MAGSGGGLIGSEQQSTAFACGPTFVDSQLELNCKT